ncbi:hypothetical protein GIB67_028539 [Kingdonia uniflora]|uniref:Uncharacterized protein n=1 Tax=Kingdonia uniflora TaxID=39325 RepID=A0A7J7KW12_9MAGN|nr:hypothetical protein GIB67_028539 [Kingdonia uniflora]
MEREVKRYSKLEMIEVGLTSARASIRKATGNLNAIERHEDPDYVPKVMMVAYLYDAKHHDIKHIGETVIDYVNESNTEKIFYGMDDINDVKEMIIVNAPPTL